MNSLKNLALKIVRFVADVITTNFGIGFIRLPNGRPFGGTITSAIAVVVFILLVRYTGFSSVSVWYFVSLIAIIVVGAGAIQLSLRAGEDDPKRAVFDEFAGVWTTFAFLPIGNEWYLDIVWAFVVFITFRITDIAKPFGVRRLERLHGGIGIMLDDIGAGVVGAIALNAIYWLIRLIIFIS